MEMKEASDTIFIKTQTIVTVIDTVTSQIACRLKQEHVLEHDNLFLLLTSLNINEALKEEKDLFKLYDVTPIGTTRIVCTSKDNKQTIVVEYKYDPI